MSSPAAAEPIPQDAVAVTPSDTAGNNYIFLYVGTGGNVSVETQVGTTVLYKNVPSGAYLWISTNKVRATNTTATDIVGHR